MNKMTTERIRLEARGFLLAAEYKSIRDAVLRHNEEIAAFNKSAAQAATEQSSEQPLGNRT